MAQDGAITNCNRDTALRAAWYERLDTEVVHPGLSATFLEGAGRFALEVDAGSRRDPNWLADRGYEVVACEPTEGMRREGALTPPVRANCPRFMQSL
jgi:hypothetical protein